MTASRRAGGALVSQFITAGGSLALQVLAARSLGASGYGAFAILVAVLVSINAIQSGWVGDSLTVLDRFDPCVRGGLLASQLLGMGIALAASATIALTLRLVGPGEAVVFASLVTLWMTEELGRRLFMARREFWLLALNDTCYVIGALGSLAVCAVVLDRLTLATFIWVMGAGSAAAILHALIQLPLAELRTARISRSGLREVSRFAAWRSAQAGLKPLVLLAVRAAVASLTSRAVLGSIEAGRLLLAPATNFVAGVGSFLLPHYSGDVRGGRGKAQPRAVCALSAILLGVVLVVGMLALVFLKPLSQVLTQGRFPIDGLVVLGWTAYAAAFAVGVPPALALVANRESRAVFLLRVIDSAVGLVSVVVVLGLGLPRLVPFGLALGGTVGAALLFLQISQVDLRSLAARCLRL